MKGRLPRDYPFPEPAPENAPAPAHSSTQKAPLPDVPRLLPLAASESAHLPPPSRPRSVTLRGAPLPRPPSHPPLIEEPGIDDTDPNEEVTEVMTMTMSPRAECTSCGYRARHVHAFLDGLCGLCRTTIGMPS